MFRKFNSNYFAFEIKSPDLQDLRAQLEVNSRRNALAVLSAAALIAGNGPP